MAPWWWLPCKPKHVGAVLLILKCSNNSTFFNVMCIIWKLKCWILLMHGVTMEFIPGWVSFRIFPNTFFTTTQPTDISVVLITVSIDTWIANAQTQNTFYIWNYLVRAVRSSISFITQLNANIIYVHEIIMFRCSCMFRHTVLPTSESPKMGNSQKASWFTGCGLEMMAKLYVVTYRSHKMWFFYIIWAFRSENIRFV